MAYAASGLSLLKTNVGGGPQMWKYKSDDAHTDVDATDYFALAGKQYGMRADDIVFVQDTDTATLTVHFVTAVDADGNATISAATLA